MINVSKIVMRISVLMRYPVRNTPHVAMIVMDTHAPASPGITRMVTNVC